jgi:hypothetical protein
MTHDQTNRKRGQNGRRRQFNPGARMRRNLDHRCDTFAHDALHLLISSGSQQRG